MADTPTTRVDTADVLAVDAEVARTTGAGRYGLGPEGFTPKPFGRLLAEKLALARALLDDAVDLRSGSAIRKLLEVSALEDARTWAALSTMYDNAYVVSATGDALSRLGEELALPRPLLEARGTVKLKLDGSLGAGESITIPRGARISSPGGHHVATDESAVLSDASRERDVAAVAFFPGPDHNLDPGVPAQKLDRWHPDDPKLADFFEQRDDAGGTWDVKVDHAQPLEGGELGWPDARYRELLLRAPRSTWTADALEIAASLVPGVRLVQVRDAWGGLDIRQSIFGNFNFIERLFAGERDIGSPYYVTVLVAPTAGAIWEGPDGLQVSVEAAIEDLRPPSIFPQVEPANQVGIGVRADLVVRGLPLPSGSQATVNASPPAVALKTRLLQRVRRYVESLGFGEPVRASEVIWALMSEPGIADAQDVRLLRFPAAFEELDFGSSVGATQVQQLALGANAELDANEIAVLVDDPTRIKIV